MQFNWNMTEKDWKRYKKVVSKKIVDSDDVFGQCMVGGLCCDFLHTMEKDDWYAFTNLFYVKEDSDYGTLADGTGYELYNNSPRIPIRCRTFESFKKTFEKIFEQFINDDPELIELTEMEDIKWEL